MEVDIKECVLELKREICKNRDFQKIEELKGNLLKNPGKLENVEEFFLLPLNIILSMIPRIDFSCFDEPILTLQNFIEKILLSHLEEQETILLLQNINIDSISPTYEEYFNIISKFTNCPFLVNFYDIYNKKKSYLNKDYQYEYEKQKEENNELKKLIEQMQLNRKIYEDQIKLNMTKPTSLETCKTKLFEAINNEEKSKISICIKTFPDVLIENFTHHFKPIDYSIKFQKYISLQCLIETMKEINILEESKYFSLILSGYPYSKQFNSENSDNITTVLYETIKEVSTHISNKKSPLIPLFENSEDSDIQTLLSQIKEHLNKPIKIEKSQNSNNESLNISKPSSLDSCKLMLYEAIKNEEKFQISICIKTFPNVLLENITKFFKPIGYSIKFQKYTSLQCIIKTMKEINVLENPKCFQLILIGYPYSKTCIKKSSKEITTLLYETIKEVSAHISNEESPLISLLEESHDSDIQELTKQIKDHI